MKRFYYILSLLFVFILPESILGILVWHTIPVINFAIFIIIISLVGAGWDIWATRHGKKDRIWLWQFHGGNTLGVRFFDLPVEEFLFYIASSTYIIFTWEGIRLALSSKDLDMWKLIPFLSALSFLAVVLPYFIHPKGDKVI